jgi:hypothetical protein
MAAIIATNRSVNRVGGLWCGAWTGCARFSWSGSVKDLEIAVALLELAQVC